MKWCKRCKARGWVTVYATTSTSTTATSVPCPDCQKERPQGDEVTIDDAVYYQMRRDLQAYAKEKRKLQRQLAEALAKVGQLMAFAHNLEFGSDAK